MRCAGQGQNAATNCGLRTDLLDYAVDGNPYSNPYNQPARDVRNPLIGWLADVVAFNDCDRFYPDLDGSSE